MTSSRESLLLAQSRKAVILPQSGHILQKTPHYEAMFYQVAKRRNIAVSVRALDQLRDEDNWKKL